MGLFLVVLIYKLLSRYRNHAVVVETRLSVFSPCSSSLSQLGHHNTKPSSTKFHRHITTHVSSYMSSFPYCSCDTAADTITMGTGKPEQYKVLNTIDVVVYTSAYPNLTA